MIQEPSNERVPLVPLEANPEALNRFLSLIGFDIQKYQFVDVFSTSDPELLNLVPRPVLGLLLVKPSSADSDSATDQQPHANLEKIWHMHQTIGGTCGSLAVLHLIANLCSNGSVSGPICKSNSWLEGFLSGGKSDLDEEYCRLHNQAAFHQSNQTSHSTLMPGKRVGTTFAAFMPVQVRDVDCDQGAIVLVELDGRKQGPILHNALSKITFLEDACQWIEQNIMKNQPNGKFAILALAANTRDND